MPKRRESPEIQAFIERMFRALERRAESGDLEAVQALASLGRSLAASTRRAGASAWAAGYSYTELADALGISRQAARQRFPNPAATGATENECLTS